MTMELTAKACRVLSYVFTQVYYGWRFGRCAARTSVQKVDILTHPKAIALGHHVCIRKHARLEAVGPWNGQEPKLTIGDYTSIHLYFHCGAAESVKIGRRVLIAGRVYISDHDHEYDHPVLAPMHTGLVTAPVVIEDEVWIGEGAVILKGVTVGRRSVIGANSVVTRDVPPYTVVGGVPAKVLKTIDAGRPLCCQD
jgi:acetyltransferase-like isoleucine patch superfamily enzyme